MENKFKNVSNCQIKWKFAILSNFSLTTIEKTTIHLPLPNWITGSSYDYDQFLFIIF